MMTIVESDNKHSIKLEQWTLNKITYNPDCVEMLDQDAP